jgi:hypothetical protein
MINQQWHNGEFNPTHGKAAGTIESVTMPWPTPEQMTQELASTAHVPRPLSGNCEGYLYAGRQQLWVKLEQSALPMRRGSRTTRGTGIPGARESRQIQSGVPGSVRRSRGGTS